MTQLERCAAITSQRANRFPRPAQAGEGQGEGIPHPTGGRGRATRSAASVR
jgi:hypothetical protein